MSVIRIAFISLLLFSFSFFFAPKKATARAGCVVPTFPKEVPGIENWVCSPVVYASAETVSRSDSINMWVNCDGFGSPPYSWSIEGTGFSLSKNETRSDGEKNVLSADASACGTGTITVSDQRGETVAVSIRCTDSGRWYRKNTGYAGLGENGPCRSCQQGGGAGKTIISGAKKWDLHFPLANYCASVSGCLVWIGANQPPCGDPHQCADGEWPCTCGFTVPFYSGYSYYEWTCP